MNDQFLNLEFFTLDSDSVIKKKNTPKTKFKTNTNVSLGFAYKKINS